MLSAEFLVVFGCILVVTFSIMGIQNLISKRTTAGIEGLATNEPIAAANLTPELSTNPEPSSTPEPVIINVVPTTSLSPTVNAKVFAINRYLLAYKESKDSNWLFVSYLDGLNVEYEDHYVTITLAKSPVREEDFKEIAYEIIRVVAYHTGAKEGYSSSLSPKGTPGYNYPDWNIIGVKVISRNMADYTIAGFVEGHDNLTKMAESVDHRDMVEYEEYYE